MVVGLWTSPATEGLRISVSVRLLSSKSMASVSLVGAAAVLWALLVLRQAFVRPCCHPGAVSAKSAGGEASCDVVFR